MMYTRAVVHQCFGGIYCLHTTHGNPQSKFRSRTVVIGASGSVVGWGTMLKDGRSRVRVPMWRIFQFTSSFQPHYGRGVDSASNRFEYQDSSCGVKGGRGVKLTNLSPSVSRLFRVSVVTDWFRLERSTSVFNQNSEYWNMVVKPQIGALFQDRLADWPSIVTQDSTLGGGSFTVSASGSWNFIMNIH
jgi:hypothetical protein